MAPSRAQFIVVNGPEQGQRLEIPKDVVIVGRAEQCDMKLLEEHISRRQFQMEHTVQGWVLENLSANGTVIGGKRYKSGMKLLLATGDIVGVGLKTELLFVATGDDADRTLLHYQRTCPPRREPVEPLPPSEPPATKELPQAPGDVPPAAAAAPSGQVAQPPPGMSSQPGLAAVGGEASQAPAKPKFKYLKYLIALGVSVMLMIVLLLLVGPGQESPTSVSGRPKQLTKDQIRDALETRPDVGGKNIASAQKALEEARLQYKSILPGHLYQCIRQYKLYQAYRGIASLDPEDDDRYRKAMFGRTLIDPNSPDLRKGEDRGLLKIVTTEYNTAMDLEIAQRWADAVKALDHLISQLDEPDPNSPTHKDLISNLWAHRTYAASMVPKKKSGQGPFGS